MPTDSTLAGATRLLDELTTVVSHAAAAILALRANALDPRIKADRSPVTAADDAAEAIILDGLRRLLPGVQIVAEEAVARTPPQAIADCFVLVDPIDGTRELIAGRDEFTVNVALMAGGRPVLGIVGAPAYGMIWRGAQGRSAQRLRLAPGAHASAAREQVAIRPRPLPDRGLVAVVSRSHLDQGTVAFLQRLPQAERIVSGSSIKLCRVAEGAADVYPRFAPVSEWDLAAGHAVVTAAGGIVTATDGTPLLYGRLDQDLRIPGFIAWGDPAAPVTLGLGRQGESVR